MFCEQQRVDAGGNLHARNGYCSMQGCTFASSLPFLACPAGATCHHLRPGGRCLKSCDMADPTGCCNHPADKHGDYECYKWNVNSVPTCEPAVPCDYLKPNWLCSLVGDSTNSTDMACRDRTTGAKLPDQTPYGYCLDTTASGP